MWFVFSIGSIFLVAVLSITRAMQLVWPFRHQNKNVAVMVIVGYFIFLFVESSLPLWNKKSYEYEWWSSCICSWKSSEVFGYNTLADKIYNQVYLFQAYIPILPILISCILTIKSLRVSENMALNRSNNSVSVTIVIFTVLFMVCNIPIVFLYLVVVVEKHIGSPNVSKFDHQYGYFFKFSNVLTICINSALNPVLYLYRMQNMRLHTKQFLSRFTKRTRNNLSPLSRRKRTEDSYIASMPTQKNNQRPHLVI